MVIDFLKKLRSQYLEEKLNLSASYDTIQIKITENQKFLERLREEDDQNFDAFSPRKQNTALRDNIQSLEKDQTDLLSDSEKIKNMMIDVDSKLAELDSVIKIALKQDAASHKSMNDSLEENDILKFKILETQEDERQRIARDLHDSSVQSLTSLVHKAELCSKLINMDPIRCKLELSSMSKTIRSIIEEMRNMIYDLRPMSFDDIGFDITLERELSRIKEHGINTQYCIEGEPCSLEPVIALTLLRVIKEACNNSLKYAEADMISVKIIYAPDVVKVVIEDNGKGFVVSENSSIRDDLTGFGLSTMRERICLLSGTITIDSKIGEGTKILIEVPV